VTPERAEPPVEEIVARLDIDELRQILTRAAGGHDDVVKVIQHADDSNGSIGDLAQELLEVHAEVCGAGVADPVELASWMARFGTDDQDFFSVDPVRYRDALGAAGVEAYRTAVLQRSAAPKPPFAVGHALERLAVLDGDIDTIVRLLGGDQTSPHQFVRVAEAMGELGRDDDVLAWAARGIEVTSGWQVAKLYDLTAGAHERRGDEDHITALREKHRRRPTLIKILDKAGLR
jgi:hypothetical protein